MITVKRKEKSSGRTAHKGRRNGGIETRPRFIEVGMAELVDARCNRPDDVGSSPAPDTNPSIVNKYKQKNDIPESNRFFDTNQDNIVIQQSACGQYFRLVYTEGKHSAWVMLKNNTGIKQLQPGYYVYHRPNLVIKFFITHN